MRKSELSALLLMCPRRMSIMPSKVSFLLLEPYCNLSFRAWRCIVDDANGTQLKNMLGMTNLLLIAVVALLTWHVFHTPKPVGRFQPFREGARLALDTKTGKLC